MKKITRDILEELKKRNAKPISGWKFTLRKSFMWIMFFATSFLAAIILIVTGRKLFQFDWDIYSILGENRALFILEYLPYFWILFLIIIFTVVFLSIRNTDKGYKYSAKKIVIISVLSIFSLGTFAYFGGFERHVENLANRNVPLIGGYEQKKNELWSQPEKGLLAGEIIKHENENLLIINDLNEKRWEVRINSADLRPRVSIEEGEIIKIIGTKKGENVFIANEIRPWEGRREGGMRKEQEGRKKRMRNGEGRSENF